MKNEFAKVVVAAMFMLPTTATPQSSTKIRVPLSQSTPSERVAIPQDKQEIFARTPIPAAPSERSAVERTTPVVSEVPTPPKVPAPVPVPTVVKEPLPVVVKVEPTPPQKLPLTPGKPVTYRNILFDTDKTTIKPESYGIIAEIAASLIAQPSIRIIIEGHTDSDASHAHNDALSIGRANAVRRVLMTRHGISGNRLQTSGKGEREPSHSNTTPEGKAQNRRVVIIPL